MIRRVYYTLHVPQTESKRIANGQVEHRAMKVKFIRLAGRERVSHGETQVGTEQQHGEVEPKTKTP
ncbi:MAG: hypothetical protein JST32_14035, partial [Bacteroidetes bacterium]|nr:hypothetical protein [Bacteroidota bacterium]